MNQIELNHSSLDQGERPSLKLINDWINATRDLQQKLLQIPGDELQEALDRQFHSFTARFTGGLSPAAALEAYLDWGIHLMISPGKQWRLVADAAQGTLDVLADVALLNTSENVVADSHTDHRFDHPNWQQWPFNLLYKSFLVQERWWQTATTQVRGVSPHHENMVAFATRQWLDMFSPGNALATNPEVIEKTVTSAGTNLLTGYWHLLQDLRKLGKSAVSAAPEGYAIGRDLATTPGKVVYRNRLIELIQYSPTTGQVHPEPILYVPAWIMKYYILDLSPHNSMIAYLVAQGFSVFAISWHNPTSDDRDLGLEDYRQLGVEAALDAIEAITGQPQVHGLGYCLGGTLLTIAAATQARGKSSKERHERFKTLTLLAAQTDFTEAGEILMFIDQSQITMLEDMMWEQGMLDSAQMAGAFQLLRSRDLIWSRMVHEYLMGEREPLSDLMAWNTDATRMPYTMHSQYLRHLFLNNELAQGHYLVDDRPISITDIRAPIFCVGTEKDHVAPWQSVYKIHLFSDTQVTFALTSSGHNAGIVSEPGHPHRHYRISSREDLDPYLDPDHWLEQTPVSDGSWWLALSDWLQQRSGDLRSPPPMGAAEQGYPVLLDAPGSYVLEK